MACRRLTARTKLIYEHDLLDAYRTVPVRYAMPTYVSFKVVQTESNDCRHHNAGQRVIIL
eukprot:scaffold5497_cov18-Prasinocladus_malaysianus.AAC.1